MKSWISKLPNKLEKELNVSLMNKSDDDDLVEYVIEAFKSLEVEKHIKLERTVFCTKESEIDINKHIYRRTKGKRKNEKFPLKYINDTRAGRLSCYFKITLPEIKDNEEVITVHQLKKDILIPLCDEHGFYHINGKKYYLIYQMVEKSTYTSANSVTEKSLMPITIKRSKENLKDVDGNPYVLPSYSIFVFKKDTPVLYFYLAKGFLEGLTLLGVREYFDISSTLPEESERDPDKIYFELSPTIVISVYRRDFESTYIKSIIGGLKKITTNRFTYDDLFNPITWIERIPGGQINQSSERRGRQILNSFNRLLDETTKKILKVHPYHKTDIYAVVRWMMQEYNSLRLKNNMDLANKRLRCNEYIASLLTLELSGKLNLLMTKGDSATWENYQDIFKFSGDILIQKMQSSGVLRFDDSVNDMDFFTKFKYTLKGPHSLGNKNSNNIGTKYRDTDPSFLGNIDCYVCGTSDPGLSGNLSPFSKIKGYYFDNNDESDTWDYDMLSEEKPDTYNDGKYHPQFKFDNSDDYYDCLLTLKRFNDSIECESVPITGDLEVIVLDEVSPDEKTAALLHV